MLKEMDRNKVERFRCTVGQPVLNTPESVLKQIEDIFITGKESDLLIFPEFSTHGDLIDLENIDYLQNDSEAFDTAQYWSNLTPAFKDVKELADKYQKAVVIGCLEQADNKLYSRAYYCDPIEGQLLHYDKSHVHWTEKFLRPGKNIEVFETRFGKIGILICYDMAFMEPTKIVSLKGAETLIVVSAVPEFFSWKYTFRRLTGAAIFNQYYVLSSNLGYTETCKMGGHCAILDPKGELIELLDSVETGCISADIDLALVNKWREEEVINKFRIPNLYKEIIK